MTRPLALLPDACRGGWLAHRRSDRSGARAMSAGAAWAAGAGTPEANAKPINITIEVLQRIFV